MNHRTFNSLIAAATLLSAGAALANAPAEKPAQLKIACVGDSITFGARIENREANCYPAQLGALMGEKATVKNFGVSGTTLLKKGNKPYWKRPQYKAALEFNPDIVVIKLGTNDTKPDNWKHKSEYVPNYVALIESFRKLPSKPEVWVCYPVPAYPNKGPISGTVVKEEILPMIDEIAKQTGVKIIDLHTPLANQQALFPDSIHPNAAGAKIIAETVKAAIAGK
ncbi:GDSL-type esterase/lipase family protein [Pontiella sp.]|uniref:GDSL-type esterase/lipase family protein n=1 Tax=Pontiella sp. TaxID=2837462 RepID=UPI003562900D